MKCMFCLNFLDENNLIHINDRLDENNETIAADLIRIHFPFAEVRLLILTINDHLRKKFYLLLSENLEEW